MIWGYPYFRTPRIYEQYDTKQQTPMTESSQRIKLQCLAEHVARAMKLCYQKTFIDVATEEPAAVAPEAQVARSQSAPPMNL